MDSSIRDISLKPVQNRVDRDIATHLRYQGYRGVFATPQSTWDSWDSNENSTVLVAYGKGNTPLGTLRIMDSRSGKMEIDSYSSKFRKNFPDNSTFVEGARLVAIRSEACSKQSVQAALWKATFQFAQVNSIDYIIVWSKKGPDRGYRYLMFEQLEGCGFTHDNLAGKRHEVFFLDVKLAESAFASSDHPLTGFFFEKQHNNLRWY